MLKEHFIHFVLGSLSKHILAFNYSYYKGLKVFFLYLLAIFCYKKLYLLYFAICNDCTPVVTNQNMVSKPNSCSQ
jgi:hypothetical protein